MNHIPVGKYLRLLIISLLFSFTAFAQQSASSETELKKQAEKAFISEKYDEALSPYSQLLSLYPNNASYNYRYGVSLLIAGKNKTNSVSFLEVAAKDPANPQEVWVYLGQSYMIIGKFEDALGCFRKFESLVNSAMLKKFNSEELKANCMNALELLKTRKNIAIISSRDVSRNEFYKFYDWSQANGKLVPAADQFLSTMDKDNQLNPVMFIANDKQTIYLSSYGKKGERGKDIYVIRKMPNGNWSTPENLGEPINSEANEDFPYLDRDGRTLYFASKSKKSIGGYDIFKSKIDFNTGQWSTPENLGWPINTIGDDYLYVPISKGAEAFYSTTISSTKSEIEIRRIQLPDQGEALVTISGYYAPTDQRVRRDARITILRAGGEGIITSVYTDPNTGKYEVTLEPGQDYVIVVEGGGYLPHAENFNLPSKLDNTELKQIVKINREKSSENLILENYFYPSSAVLDVPSEVKSASYDTNVDSTSMMAIQINNETVLVTKPGSGVQTTASGQANPNILTIEKKDEYDPTLEHSATPDEIRQKKEEEGRAMELADDNKKGTNYDVTIGNEELASIAILDAKTSRQEADSLNREVERLKAGAIERDSLSAQMSIKAENATEQEKPAFLNEAYTLKADADNMRRQADDLKIAAMAKDTEAKASEQEANELLATINDDKSKKSTKDKPKATNVASSTVASTKVAHDSNANTNVSKGDSAQFVKDEIKELSAAETPVTTSENSVSDKNTVNDAGQNSIAVNDQISKEKTEGNNVSHENTLAKSEEEKKYDVASETPSDIKSTKTDLAEANVVAAEEVTKSESADTKSQDLKANGIESNVTEQADAKSTVKNVVVSEGITTEPANEKLADSNSKSEPTNKVENQLTPETKVVVSTGGIVANDNATRSQAKENSPDQSSGNKDSDKAAINEIDAKNSPDVISENVAQSESPVKSNEEGTDKTISESVEKNVTGESGQKVNTSENNLPTSDTGSVAASEQKINVESKEFPSNTTVETKVEAANSKSASQVSNKDIVSSTVSKVEQDETISSKSVTPAVVPDILPDVVSKQETSDQSEKSNSKLNETIITDSAIAKVDQTEKSISEINQPTATSTSVEKNTSQIPPSGEVSENVKTETALEKSSEKSSDVSQNAPSNPSDVKQNQAINNSDQEIAANTTQENSTKSELPSNEIVNENNSAVENTKVTSTVELKPPFIVPAEEKKPLPENINTLKLNPVSEEARIAYQAFKSKYKNSKQLSDQSIGLQNRISDTKSSPERDSLIYVSNSLVDQSNALYDEALAQLRDAESIDPDVKHKMEVNEQIIAYNSSMPTSNTEKNSPTLNEQNVPNANSETIANTDSLNQQLASNSVEHSGDNVENVPSESNIATTNETVAETVPAVSDELTPEEAKAVEEATTFTVETPNGKEVVKIDTTGIDTRHPEFQKYVDVNKEITAKQVETIDVFADAVNQNKLAVEQKEEQNRLMDQAEVEQDRPTKAQIFIKADAMRDSSKKNEEESAAKFAIAQSKTGEVKSKTAEMQEIRKRIARPGSQLPEQATISKVSPKGLTEEEVLAMTKPEEKVNSTNEKIAATESEGNAIPTTTFSPEKVEQFAKQSFSISNAPVYSKENPIPMNPPIPDGLVFKVQIGAFRNEIPGEKFEGVQPITAETTRPGWVRYCVGLFQTFEPAVVVKKEMQQRGFKDAFVVAYLNGKRIALDEAYAMIGKGKSSPDKSYVQTSQTEMALLRANNIRPENISSIRNNVIDVDEKTFYGENASNVKKSLAAVEYSVQVGVYRTQVTPKGLQTLAPLFTEKIRNDLYRFTTDHYMSYASADSMKRIARREGVKDAFIVVYRNGVQSALSSVPIAERTLKSTTASGNVATSIIPNSSVSSTPSVVKPATQNTTENTSTQTFPSAVTSGGKIIYRVQIGAFKNNIPFTAVVTFLNIADKGITQLTDDRGLHIFYAGTLENFSSASALREEIVSKGVTDAFVVALQDGKRVTLTEEMKK